MKKSVTIITATIVAICMLATCVISIIRNDGRAAILSSLFAIFAYIISFEIDRGESRNTKTTRKVKVKKLSDNAIIPTRGTDGSAGFDLYACIDEFVKVPPHKTVKIGTGIAMEVPEGTFGGVFARSGLANKKGLAPANCVGVIDSDYRGEITVSIHNYSNYSTVVQPRDRIAQIIIMKYEDIIPVETEVLSNTVRGSGGFGSTGD